MNLRFIILPVFSLAVIAPSGCSAKEPSDGWPSVSEIEKALKSYQLNDQRLERVLRHVDE